MLFKKIAQRVIGGAVREVSYIETFRQWTEFLKVLSASGCRETPDSRTRKRLDSKSGGLTPFRTRAARPHDSQATYHENLDKRALNLAQSSRGRPHRSLSSRFFRSTVLGVVTGLCWGCAAPHEPDFDADAMSRDALYAQHGSPEEGFFVPWAEDPMSPGTIFRWLFSLSAYRGVDAPELPSVRSPQVNLRQPAVQPRILWIGHSSFAIHEGSNVVLTDPHFGNRALIPRRLTPPGIALDAVPPEAYAVISHNHYDHLDADTVARLPATMHWFVPLGLATWFRERGRENVVELDWWESRQRGEWTFTCLPSQHSSRRIEQGANRSLWCQWLIESPQHRYFFAGDTGYFHGFREFGARYEGIDVAMLPIGAYAPRWFMKFQHMNPEEAVHAFDDLRAAHMIGMHWGTFNLTDEPPTLPPVELERVLETRDVDRSRIHVLDIGEIWTLPSEEESAEPR